MNKTKYLKTSGFNNKEELDSFIEEQYKYFKKREKVGIVQTPGLPITEFLLEKENGVEKVVTQVIREIKRPSLLQDPLDHRGYSKLDNFSDFVRHVAGRIQEKPRF